MSTTPERLDDLEIQKTTPANIRFISTTDPDASVTRHSSGKSKLRYKKHRAVDERCEVITATKITPGSVDDSHVLKEMFETHEQNTQKKANTAVGESKYGTIENFFLCHDLGITAHIPSFEQTHRGSGRQKGIFAKEVVSYDLEKETFICPAIQTLRRRNYNKKRKQYEYKASAKICA